MDKEEISLRSFMVEGASPTGRELGIGSYGVVQEVSQPIDTEMIQTDIQKFLVQFKLYKFNGEF